MSSRPRSRRRAVVLFGLGALLAACAAPPAESPPADAAAIRPPPPITTPPSTSGCARWLDPFTKNTDLAPLYYQLASAERQGGASPMAVVETGRAAIARTREGIDKVIVTIPLEATYDAQKGIAHMPSDPARGDSIFFDAPGATNTLGAYTVAADSTDSVSADWSPIPPPAGPRGEGRVSRGARYGVALLDLDPRTGGAETGGRWASAKGGLDVPLSPQRAKAAYGRLSVKIVAELVLPGILAGTETHPATREAGEWEAELRLVTVRTLCAAIVTANDGEMVKQLR